MEDFDKETVAEVVAVAAAPVVRRVEVIVAQAVIENEIAEVGPVLGVKAQHPRLIGEFVPEVFAQALRLNVMDLELPVPEIGQLESYFGSILPVELEVEIGLVV